MDAILLLDALALIKIPILNLTLWKLREITLLTLSQGMLPLEGSTAFKHLSWSKGIFSQMVTGKLAREAQQLASEKEKQDWKSNNY